MKYQLQYTYGSRSRFKMEIVLISIAYTLHIALKIFWEFDFKLSIFSFVWGIHFWAALATSNLMVLYFHTHYVLTIGAW